MKNSAVSIPLFHSLVLLTYRLYYSMVEFVSRYYQIKRRKEILNDIIQTYFYSFTHFSFIICRKLSRNSIR